jgi:hypothetical protein
MDDLVLRGMAKWPDVPAVYGWLALDRRGHWLIKGDRITNPTVTAFMGRNYDHDAEGRWFFQNGPQRVFVTLDYTPFVYRVAAGAGSLRLEPHTGAAASALTGAWIDEAGTLLLESGSGIGLLHDHDLPRILPYFIDANGNRLPEEALESLMALVEQQREAPLWLNAGDTSVKVACIRSAEVPTRFGFVPSPKQPDGETPCP